MRIFVITIGFIVSLALSNAESIPDEILNKMNGKVTTKQLFKTYIFLFKKNYDLTSELAKQRYSTFKLNLAKHNDKVKGFEMQFNEFFDLNADELADIFGITDKNFDQVPVQDVQIIDKNRKVYDQIDHRLSGCVSVEEFPSGGTWAIATSVAVKTAIEAELCLKTKVFTQLSLQQIIDCSGTTSLWPSDYFYYMLTKGLVSKASYPFTSFTNGTCKDSTLNEAPRKIRSWESIPSLSTNVIMDTSTIIQFLKRGPIISYFNFYKEIFTYKSGIVYPANPSANCGYYWAGAVIGYGVDPTGVEYWLVKTFLGNTIGDKGVMKLALNDTYKNYGISCDLIRPVLV